MLIITVTSRNLQACEFVKFAYTRESRSIKCCTGLEFRCNVNTELQWPTCHSMRVLTFSKRFKRGFRFCVMWRSVRWLHTFQRSVLTSSSKVQSPWTWILEDESDKFLLNVGNHRKRCSVKFRRPQSFISLHS